MSNDKKVQLSFYLSHEMRKGIKMYAAENDMTISTFINVAVANYPSNQWHDPNKRKPVVDKTVLVRTNFNTIDGVCLGYWGGDAWYRTSMCDAGCVDKKLERVQSWKHIKTEMFI